jgi:uncharacterized protein
VTVASFESEASLAGAPALVLAEGDPAQAAGRGAVLVYHGLGGHKAVQRPELERLARAGLLAVGVDAVGHGARRWPDFEARLGTADEAERAFSQVVRQTAAEVPQVVNALLARRWGLPGRVGVTGVSLGAFVAYGAAVAERRLGAVVAFEGSPEWGDDEPGSPHLVLDRFFPVPLLSVTAGQDTVVPPAAVLRLHAALERRYATAPERLVLRSYPASGHRMEPRDWEAAWGEAVPWLTRFLGTAAAPGPRLAPATREALELGRAHFNAGRHFEAHEVWEDAWRQERGPTRAALQGLIQVAAGYFKALQERNPAGTVKLLERALETLAACPADALGLDLEPWRAQVAQDLERARRWAAGSDEAPVARAPRLEER